jgi:hypothetical protein
MQSQRRLQPDQGIFKRAHETGVRCLVFLSSIILFVSIDRCRSMDADWR